MSNAVSALNKASYTGFADVKEIGLQGMITLRGDLGTRAMKKAIKAACGLAVPGIRAVNLGKDTAVAWMSPDELLVLVPYDAVDSALTSLHKALAKQHFMAENVSDARAVFRIFGPKSREVLAKLCPVDLSTEAFQPGTIRRSRMAQIPAAIWMTDAQTLQVICFRSVADYAFGVLKVAAMPGSEVGYLA